ncbi:hypothetical protein [Tepidibacillus sp. HK-1]|nr:hypothetical protein [Tepidibacillus sp. HK-1]GBF12645.1 hypothetical protein HK1_02728 [Tepidibacillus sp. HK-1]
MNEKNNGKHIGHQDPKQEKGNDQKGHNGGQRISTNPGNSHALLK